MNHQYKRLRLWAAVLVLACAGAVWGQAVPVRSQNGIAREVGHELVTLPFYMVFDHLSFREDGGTVTLLGSVTRAALKSDAEKAVKQIAGVRRVNNEIEVLPLSAADAKIRLAEYLAIYGDPQLNQYALRAIPPIHIVVKNAAVTLEGSVAAEADKTEAFTQASGVPGVTTLTNHLQIAP
jgi:hyperosmotically inducible protein